MIRAVVILGLAALVLMAPALMMGAPAIDSATYTEVWTRQFASEMARGELWPRWMPDSFEGLGAPTFYFYPPLAFVVSGALAMVLAPPLAISVAGAVLLFASGLAMYAWLRGRTGWALAGAVVYMAAPYHLADFYVRATLAEFAAFVWLPLIAMAIEARGRGWAGPMLAVAYAGLVMTHLPVALLASVILIPPLVARAAWAEPMAAARCAAAGAAGLLLAALYLVPALTLQDHTLMPQLMWRDHFDADQWTVLALLDGRGDTFLAAMSWLAAGWAVVAGAAVLRGGRFWPAVALWAAACSLGLVPLTALPLIEKVQFPWRALAVVEFAAITALALWRPRPLALAAGALLLIQGAHPLGVAAWAGLRQEVPPSSIAAMVDAVEYLPASYRPVPPGRAPAGLEAYAGPLVRGPVTQVRAWPDGTVSLRATQDGPVTIRRALFPRWRVLGEAGAVPLGPGPLVSFEARAGQRYRLVAAPTPAEVTGGWLSLLGVGLLALWGWRVRRGAHSKLKAPRRSA